MAVCGPKLSLCGLIISVWGIFQLLIMGIFYYIKSVALFEDLGMKTELGNDPAAFYKEAEDMYTQNAFNCWIAACIYVVMLVFSAQQFYANHQTSHTT